ncbi:MAG: LytR family transcriptional regulator [Firmicutes bacterium]|nr:LytR family transcriptional regulator [Bacillota bacterium]
MAKKRKLKRKMPFVIFCILMIAVFAASYGVVSKFVLPQPPGQNQVGNNESGDNSSGPAPKIGKRLNFLLMGIDARPGETKARTDTMVFVSVDEETNRIAMMSIPRDTRVEIPRRGVDKVNAANVYGGPDLATETVSELLGVPIDYYVLTNFNGFQDIVDAVGGVNMNVERNMQYYDPMDGTRIDLKKGEQLLDGDKALQYVRFRGYGNGDIGRADHQQKFLKALAKEVLQPSTVTKLHKLVPSVNKAVNTNLGVVQMAKLANAARNLSNTDIVTQTLPGGFMTIDGISYWNVEPTAAHKAVANIFDGKTMEVVQKETVNIETEEYKEKEAEKKETEEEKSADEAGESGEQQDVEQPPTVEEGAQTTPDDGKTEPADSEEAVNQTPEQQQDQPQSTDSETNNGTEAGGEDSWLPQVPEQQPVEQNNAQPENNDTPEQQDLVNNDDAVAVVQ